MSNPSLSHASFNLDADVLFYVIVLMIVLGFAVWFYIIEKHSDSFMIGDVSRSFDLPFLTIIKKSAVTYPMKQKAAL